MIKNVSLHTRMVVVAVLLTLFVTLCLDMSGVYIIRNYMTQRFKGRIAFLSKYLAVNSEVGVLIRDRAGLKSLAANLLGEEDVAQVIIYSSDGETLVEQTRQIPGKLLTVETRIKLNKADDENMLFTRYEYTPFGTLSIPGVESIGKVHIKYSTRGIDRLIWEITRLFLIITTGLTLLSGVLFYFIVKSIVVDITKLAVVSRLIGDGDNSLRAEAGKLPETRELASAFNTMLDSLENSRKAYEKMTKEALRQKTLAELGKFSLSVAHEIKNPLAIIKSAFEFFKNEYAIPQDHTMSVYIEEEIQRINKLIEDFLLFAKPENIRFADHRSHSVIKHLMPRYEMLYDEKPVQFHLILDEKDAYLRVDEGLLTRVFDNIVKNAVEASPENGTIRINSYYDEGMWFVEVSDQGAGLGEGCETKVFEPFYTTKSKGTGLGLALAYQIVKAHDGVMRAMNSGQGGAVFTVGLPVENLSVKG